MDTYVLYIFGTFETHEDILYYCTDVMPSCPAVDKLVYVMECSQSLILVFESTLEESDIVDELPSYVVNENVKFYFLHRLKDTLTAYLPPELNDMIYKVQKIQTEEEDIEPKKTIYSLSKLDDILDKIEKTGYDSLTEEEKKFLTNFDKE